VPSLLLDPDARPVVGHRGNAAHAPENTLESFAQALAAGAEALEFDVHVTRDGVPVVHHDPTLDRTTSGGGPVAGRTLAENHLLDDGARFTSDGGRTFPYRGRAVGVPTLDEVLGAFPGVPAIVELKTAAAAPPARRVLDRHGAAVRTVVASFDDRALDPFRESAFALGATGRDVAALLRAALLGARIARPAYRAACVPPRYRGVPLPLARFARLLRPHGCTLHVWTVDTARAAAALWAAGINGVISNDPGAVLAARRADRDAGAGEPAGS
jgi:glycerophosphoryl diester phosphodiesterase